MTNEARSEREDEPTTSSATARLLRVQQGEVDTRGTAGSRRTASQTVRAVHRQLRDEILSGRYPLGAVLSQVQLAERYGVSRTPLREALRLLEEEGLIHAESNRRARVAEFHFDDLEAISAQRILLGAVATSVTVPMMDEADLAAMDEALESMVKAQAQDDVDAWKQADRLFHSAHMAHSPLLLRQDLERLSDRSALYCSVWARDTPHRDAQSADEHLVILEACQRHDPIAAAQGIARHRARIAISVMAGVMPEKEPACIRSALQIALGTGTSSSPASR